MDHSGRRMCLCPAGIELMSNYTSKCVQILRALTNENDTRGKKTDRWKPQKPQQQQCYKL